MILREFNYAKADAAGNVKVTNRKVLLLHSNDKYFDGIDFSHLSIQEAADLISIQKRYEEDLKQFSSAYRRFSVNNTVNAVDKKEGK
jgi:hypothetical protein